MSDQNEVLLYTAPDGAGKVDVFFKVETVWLTQNTLAELFGVKVPAVNKHLRNFLNWVNWFAKQLFPKWK